MSSMFTMDMFEEEILAGGNKRYFVCTDGYHYKYYITEGYTVRYGRIGNEPVIFNYPNEREVERKIRSKLNKGYREVNSVEELKHFYLVNK